MRLTYFSADTVPEEFRGGLAHRRGRTPRGLTVGAAGADAPGAGMVRVPASSSRGGKLDVTHMRALVRRLGEVISDLGAGARRSR